MQTYPPPPPPPPADVEGTPFPITPAPVAARRLPLRSIVGLLIAGIVVGGGAAYGVYRAQGSPGGTVSIAYDNTPVHASTSNAVAVFRQLGPAVGTVIAGQPNSTTASLGSGFVIGHSSSVSYLVTNNHVVVGSSQLHVVMPNGDSYAATLVGRDQLDDLAVVSVPNASLPAATWGDSAQLQVGQPVIAIGSPLGNQSSVTAGVISALHRTISASGENSTTTETLEDVLQTDASINPGNSGGPLADVEGRVVGVNVATAGSATNIGFSIPANLARQVTAELIAHQKVEHPFLGIAYLDSITAIEQGRGFNGAGVLVTLVSPNTPAAAAGFQPGDVLVAIDGVPIDNGETLGGLIQTKRDGQTIVCTVSRHGQTLTLSATLEERPGNL